MEPRCESCTTWETKDGLTGFCITLTDALNGSALIPCGVAPVRTAASGNCTAFEPSWEALDLERQEAKYRMDLVRAAGDYYPASLSPAGAYELQRWKRP